MGLMYLMVNGIMKIASIWLSQVSEQENLQEIP